MKYYIGLDAHSTTSTFAVVDENGQCILRETVKTSEQSLVHVINKIHGERHMTFEESTISSVALFATERQGRQSIDLQSNLCGKKTGEQKLIFAMLFTWPRNSRTNHLQPVFHDTSHWMEIRTTVSGYLDIVEEIVRFKNRLKAVF
ncbi:MAG: hypothetical protein IPK68_14585 [Bdellovibrionales bacterium]|nr:hypothetical protein [Bdellovibrionales bacterium]